MNRRNDEEPRPIQGAQIDAPEEDAPTLTALHEDLPPADAPVEEVPSAIPGTSEAARARPELDLKGVNPFIQVFKLMREGLRPSNLRSSYGRTPLVLLMSLGVINVFLSQASTIALPDIQRSLKINLISLASVFSYIGLVGLLLSVPIGYAGDRYRRVTMYGVGEALSSLGIVFYGLATGKGMLIWSGTMTEIGATGPDAVGFSLISDYVPPESRGQSFAFRAQGAALGGIIAPLIVGTLGAAFGWRFPFILFGVMGAVVSLIFLRMPEPIRGYHERKAWGADEEAARRQQAPPSWGEAFRAAYSVRTLRRIAYSIPFADTAAFGFGFIYPFFLARTHGVTLLGRGIAGAVAALAALLGLSVGGPLTDRLIGRNPGRVVMIAGLASIGTAMMYIPIALIPPGNPIPVITLGTLVIMFNAVIRPAQFTVSSLVIPPRLRNLGLASLNYWDIPVRIIAPLVLGVAFTHGLRSGLLVFIPFAVLGGIIHMTAGPFVEFDIRSATAAAMAAEEWKRAREEGRAKLLVLRKVDVHYEAVQVLFDIDLDILDGELIALLGTNGAGKSTLLRAISGTQQASGGAIVFDGKDITAVPPYEIAAVGIAQTPGGRGIFPGLTVRENIQLAGWLYGEDPKHKEDVEKIFEYFPTLRDKLDQVAGSLSGGEQQMLTLAQAFLARPKLLMIDELSLGLAPAIVEQLLAIVRAIHENGTTIIIVEQSVNIALTLAKRAIFMEKGEVRFDGPTEDLLGRPDIMRAVFLKGGKSLSVNVGPEGPRKLEESERTNILEVRGLVKSYGGVNAVNDVSFDLRENETLGLIGPNGAGKTTVLELISGYNEVNAGQVIFEGRDITALPPDQRAKLGLIRRFQDAKLFPSLTVGDNIAIAFERQVAVRSMIVQSLGLPQARQSEASIRRKVDALIELLGLEAYRDKFVSEVSTGTRRIIDLGKVLAAEPRVLLLDEPSSGLAQRESENLAPLLQQVRRETGCALIIIEHDMPLISAVSDELLAMDLGKVIARGTPEEVLNDERVVRSYLGTTEEVIQRSGRIKGK